MSRIISMREIEQISRESAKILYGSDAVNHQDESNNNDDFSLFNSQKKEPIPRNAEASVFDRDKSNLQLENALKIITAQGNISIPFLFRSEAATLARIKGAATLQAAEKEALMAKIIKKHEIAIAKTNKILWEITDRGYTLIKSERPKWKSKGEYKHKFCVYRIAHSFKQQGYKSTIEYRLANGKLVDLILSKNNETIYAEICASFPVEKELVNIEKDLDNQPLPTALYLFVTDRKMKQPLKQVLHDFSQGFSPPCPIEVKLAGDMITPLENM